jgi:hypothetical protein
VPALREKRSIPPEQPERIKQIDRKQRKIDKHRKPPLLRADLALTIEAIIEYAAQLPDDDARRELVARLRIAAETSDMREELLEAARKIEATYEGETSPPTADELAAQHGLSVDDWQWVEQVLADIRNKMQQCGTWGERKRLTQESKPHVRRWWDQREQQFQELLAAGDWEGLQTATQPQDEGLNNSRRRLGWTERRILVDAINQLGANPNPTAAESVLIDILVEMYDELDGKKARKPIKRGVNPDAIAAIHAGDDDEAASGRTFVAGLGKDSELDHRKAGAKRRDAAWDQVRELDPATTPVTPAAPRRSRRADAAQQPSHELPFERAPEAVDERSVVRRAARVALKKPKKKKEIEIFDEKIEKLQYLG